jgi:hypothetical protein
MSAVQRNPRILFDILDKFSATLREEVGPVETETRLRLVQTLLTRLSHKYLLEANKAEIQAAGRVMMAEGRSRAEMKTLQATLVALYDQAYNDGSLPVHPLRGLGESPARPKTTPRTALTVGVGSARVDAIRELLLEAGVLVYPEPSHQKALELVAWFPFSFILSTLPAMKPIPFLKTIRETGILCRGAGLVLLVRDEQMQVAESYVGRGANRVIPLSGLAERLPAMISELSTVAERVSIRFPVQVELDMGLRTETWQCVNISSTGMLVRTSEEIPKGSHLDLQFTVPGDDLPIRASAEVVRRTTFGREDFTGLGLRYVSFVGEGQHRLDLFLRAQMS